MQFHHDVGYTCIVYFQIRVFVSSECEFFGCVCKPVICVVFLCPLEMQFWVEFPTWNTWWEVLTKTISIGILRQMSLYIKAGNFFFRNISVVLKKGMFRTCVVKIYSNIYPTRCNFTQFIYIWKLLYMFRVVPPPIITSANNCVYSIWYLSHRFCYLPLSWKSWNWFECAVTLYIQHSFL